jgi:ribosomal protein S1
MNKKVIGEVIGVNETKILVDLPGHELEGIMDLEHYSTERHSTFAGLVKVGDSIECCVMNQHEVELDPSNHPLLSRIPLIEASKYNEFREHANERTYTFVCQKYVDRGIEGYIKELRDGRSFLPYSLLGFKLTDEDKKQTNRRLEVEILETPEFGEKRKSILVTHKGIMDREYKAAKASLESLKASEYKEVNVGDKIRAKVEKVAARQVGKDAKPAEFGYFLSYKHLSLLLLFSELDHQFVQNAGQLLKVGQEIDVVISSKDNNKLACSIKQLTSSPVDVFYDTHKLGDIVVGKIAKKLPSLVLVDLGNKVLGALHNSEYSYNDGERLQDVAREGDEIELMIINLDREANKISLSKKQMEENPWADVKYKKGDKVKVKVKNFVAGGMVVSLGKLEGFIANVELNDERGSRAENLFNIDDEVECVITEINYKEWKLKFSIKRLERIEDEKEYEIYSETKFANTRTLADIIDEEDNPYNAKRKGKRR